MLCWDLIVFILLFFFKIFLLQDRRARLPPGAGGVPRGEVEAHFQRVVPGVLHFRQVHADVGTSSLVVVLVLVLILTWLMLFDDVAC